MLGLPHQNHAFLLWIGLHTAASRTWTWLLTYVAVRKKESSKRLKGQRSQDSRLEFGCCDKSRSRCLLQRYQLLMVQCVVDGVKEISEG